MSFSRRKEEKTIFEKLESAAYIEVDLDAITHNVECVKKMAGHTAIMGVVKGNAYGHGLTSVAHHLEKLGIPRLATANVKDAVTLRRSGIKCPIHVLGSLLRWEGRICIQHGLIPSISTVAAAEIMGKAIASHTPSDGGSHLSSISRDTVSQVGLTNQPEIGSVHVKVDTGLSRFGCKPCELSLLIEACERHSVPIEGIYSHVANISGGDCSQQEDLFRQCIQLYRDRGYLFHLSCSSLLMLGRGLQYDMVRIGSAIYGQVQCILDDAKDRQETSLHSLSQSLRQSLSLHATPSLAKYMSAGSKVGYNGCYVMPCDMWVVTLPVGYNDGLWRAMTTKWHVRRNSNGENCLIVGTMSMDSVVVTVSSEPKDMESFSLITRYGAFDCHHLGKEMGTEAHDILVKLGQSIPRHYVSNGLV